MCADLLIIPTTTVSHRGGSCLHIQRNRHENVQPWQNRQRLLSKRP